MKKVKGTVATRMTPKGARTSPLRVMREYLSWGLTPSHWGDARAMELAATMQWALNNISGDIKKAQGRVEDRVWRRKKAK